MKNHILLAILAGLIAVSQTMDYQDQVQHASSITTPYDNDGLGCMTDSECEGVIVTDCDDGACPDNNDDNSFLINVSEITVDPVDVEYIGPDTEHEYTLYA